MRYSKYLLSSKIKIKALLPKNRFARSVSVLAGGTAVGQAIVVLASPLLTRLYTPEDFGILAIFASILGILGIIASLSYHLAIPLPESDEKSAQVLVLSFFIVLGMTLICALIVWWFGADIASLLNTPGLAPYLWLVPPGLLLLGSYQVLNYWAIRNRVFSAIARTKLTQALSMTVVQLGGFALGPLALLLGRVFGQAAGVLVLFKASITPRKETFQKIRAREIAQVAYRYRRFPIYSTWGGGFNQIGSELPPLLFAALFNPAIAGIYMLAHRVLQMPAALIGQSVAQVFLPKAVDASREGLLAPLVLSMHRNLAHIAMSPALILLLTGPELFLFTFGNDWAQAGEFSQWMAPWIYLVFISSPLSNVTSIMEQQAVAAVFNAFQLLIRLAAILIGAWYESVTLALILYAISNAFYVLCYTAWIFKISGNKFGDILHANLSALAVALILCFPTIFTILWLPYKTFVIWSVALSGIFILFYYTVLYKQVIATHSK